MIANPKYNLTGFTKYISSGITQNNMAYIVMVKNGPNLKNLIRKCKSRRFSIKTTLQIGIQMIERLESLHFYGYLHLDLKPDNILLSSGDRSDPKASTLVLIDFGLSKRYLDEKGEHIEDNPAPFVGNVLFASKNTLQ